MVCPDHATGPIFNLAIPYLDRFAIHYIRQDIVSQPFNLNDMYNWIISLRANEGNILLQHPERDGRTILNAYCSTVRHVPRALQDD